MGAPRNRDAAKILSEVHVVGERVAVLRAEGVGVLSHLRRDDDLTWKQHVRGERGVVIEPVSLVIPAENLGTSEDEALDYFALGKPLVACAGLIVSRGWWWE